MDNLFLDESSKQLSKLIFDTVKSVGGSLWDRIKSRSKNAENYFDVSSSKYVKRFHQRFGYVQVLGMNEPMSLANVYVDVKVLNNLGNSQYFTIDKLKNSFEDSRSNIRNFQNSDSFKLKGIDVAEVEPRLMVVGAPGGGKSTYLKKIGIECLKPQHVSILNKLFPILIELRNVDAKNDIGTLILKELEIADFPHPVEFLEKALQNGKLLILFDGLDEVTTELENDTINHIRNFCDQYSRCRFVVSCRVAAYKGGLPNFKNIEIANLDKSQIHDFIVRWFEEKSKANNINRNVAQTCWEKINDPEFGATLELAQSPLLLTLLCLVYNYQQDFPKNRALLYREAINVLLKEWNAEKRIHSNTVYKEMTLPFEELLLSHIAHNYFIKDEYFFDKAELSQFISEFISNNLNAPKFLDGSQILDAISIQQGILVERAKNIYSFSHLTFQEYFTAKHIDDYGLLDNYTNLFLFNSKWREIFILLCGIIKAGSDRLLKAIVRKAREEFHSNEVLRVLFQKVIQIEGDKGLQTRLLNLILILIFSTNFNKTLGTFRAFDKILSFLKEVDLHLYEELTKSWIIDMKPNVDMHYRLYIEFLTSLKGRTFLADIIHENLLKYANHKSIDILNREIAASISITPIFIDTDNRKAIDAYFENLVFLMQCKKSSIMVSRDCWNEIENMLIMP